jgi:hypothetical protein
MLSCPCRQPGEHLDKRRKAIIPLRRRRRSKRMKKSTKRKTKRRKTQGSRYRVLHRYNKYLFSNRCQINNLPSLIASAPSSRIQLMRSMIMLY